MHPGAGPRRSEASAAAVRVEAPEPLDVDAAPAFAAELRRVDRRAGEVTISLGRVRTVDAFGMAALVSGVLALRERGASVRVVELAPEVRRRAGMLRVGELLAPAGRGGAPPPGPWERLLGGVSERIDRVVVILAMLHHGLRHAARDCLGSRLGREQLVRQLDQTGALAVPLVAGVTFLIGAIMAFQTAYVAEPYGGTAFVPRGIAVSLTREIGPLMAALLVAGRSGSAIAAELGSMVVYEEVDALEMMALRPRRFLLSPRFVALCLALPALSVLADVCGIGGGALVMNLAYEVGWSTIWEGTVQGLLLRDLASGLIKSIAFGGLIAVVACRQGLALRGGPEAIGRAATSAVVGGVLAVVLFDAVFTAATRGFL